jgi:S1-C subfamily serine protease
VCDSDIALKRVRNCLILARGSVQIKDIGVRSHIVSMTQVEKGSKAEFHDVIATTEKRPSLGFAIFFEPPQVGIEVAIAGDAVKVTKVAPKTLLGVTDLRANDVILQIDDDPVDSPDHLRRLLQRFVATSSPFTMKVKRGSEILQIPVGAAP